MKWSGRILALMLMASTSLGCQASRQIRDREYATLTQHVQQARIDTDETKATPIPSPEFMGTHSLEEYIQIALGQNPRVQAVRKRMEALAHRVPVEASLQDPSLTVTVQPQPVQTAAGQQDAILALSQRFPWFGKLAAKAGVAEAETNVARAELAAIELETVAKVKKAYFELFFVQKAIEVTEADQQLLLEIRTVADARYRSGSASQQDVLRANLEISDTESQLIQLRQQLDSAQARLARHIHVAPNSELLANETSPSVPTILDLETLQRTAVSARPELHVMLAKLNSSRMAVELARLDYKPDVTLGMSWIDVSNSGVSPVANGRDSVLLSAGINLPIYRKRLDSAVRSAEASAVSAARNYDALRDETLEQVTDLFAKVESQREMLELFENDILPTARQTLAVSSQAYNVGEVDFLQLVDNWRQLFRYEITNLRLQATLQQTLAELEQTVGGLSVSEENVRPPATSKLLSDVSTRRE